MNVYIIIFAIIFGLPTPCLANPFIFTSSVSFIYKILMFFIVILAESGSYCLFIKTNLRKIVFKICIANIISTLVSIGILIVIAEIDRIYNLSSSIWNRFYFKLSKIALLMSTTNSDKCIMFLFGAVLAVVIVFLIFLIYFYVERTILLNLFKNENSEIKKYINKVCFRFNLAIYLIVLFFLIIATYINCK